MFKIFLLISVVLISQFSIAKTASPAVTHPSCRVYISSNIRWRDLPNAALETRCWTSLLKHKNYEVAVYNDETDLYLKARPGDLKFHPYFMQELASQSKKNIYDIFPYFYQISTRSLNKDKFEPHDYTRAKGHGKYAAGDLDIKFVNIKSCADILKSQEYMQMPSCQQTPERQGFQVGSWRYRPMFWETPNGELSVLRNSGMGPKLNGIKIVDFESSTVEHLSLPGMPDLGEEGTPFDLVQGQKLRGFLSTRYNVGLPSGSDIYFIALFDDKAQNKAGSVDFCYGIRCSLQKVASAQNKILVLERNFSFIYNRKNIFSLYEINEVTKQKELKWKQNLDMNRKIISAFYDSVKNYLLLYETISEGCNNIDGELVHVDLKSGTRTRLSSWTDDTMGKLIKDASSNTVYLATFSKGKSEVFQWNPSKKKLAQVKWDNNSDPLALWDSTTQFSIRGSYLYTLSSPYASSDYIGTVNRYRLQ